MSIGATNISPLGKIHDLLEASPLSILVSPIPSQDAPGSVWVPVRNLILHPLGTTRGRTLCPDHFLPDYAGEDPPEAGLNNFE